MAEAAEPTGEPQSAEVKTQQPAEKGFRPPQRRDPRSVLKVSQLLLGAISSHKGLTLDVLKNQLGNAGYQVRRKNFRPSGEAALPEVKLLLRASGSDNASYFGVWKVPKPQRKPKCEEGSRAARKTRCRPRGPRGRRTRPTAARRAREGGRRSTTADAEAERARPQAQDRGRPGTREAAAEGSRPRTREEKRSGSTPRPEKDAEKLARRAVRKPTPLETDPTSGEQGKTPDPRAAGAKAPAKAKGSRKATGNS
ncbi:testis-specific H1 histone [Dasypus novemcinctus]|uniref:testis-specific H1 histone n=1 Tax=Dasypus novemcinctus TaxID=9361 RepID=UPI00265E3ECD|nr:testis-specific H1 histone [Dasypus novemcinctus]